MTAKLSGPMAPPRSGKAKKAVVLLHGYGSDGNDLISLQPYLADLLPDAVFVAPNAPAPCAINPAGYEWFPLDLDREISRLEGIDSTRPVISGFLNDLWAETGLAAKDTLLCGFSQGAMIALDSGLRLPETLFGIISFSGGVVAPEKLGDEIKAKPPVCLIHGDSDDVVPPRMSLEGENALKAAGVDVRLHISPGTGHSIAQDGLVAARQFISERLGVATA